MPAHAVHTEPLPLNGKRKRDNSLNNTFETGGVDRANAHAVARDGDSSHVNQVISDICAALQKYDTTPALLTLPLDAGERTDNSGAPILKRAKVRRTSDEADTISRKVERQAYASLADFVEDVEQAARQSLADSTPRDNSSAVQWKYQPDSLDADRLYAQIRAFKKILRTFVSQHTDLADDAQSFTDERKDVLNGEVKAEDSASTELDEATVDRQGKAVLTLFGNAQGQHKQLFSSFQKPAPPQLWSRERKPLVPNSDALLPLRENGLLGNQIISTRLIAMEGADALPASKKTLHFRDLFRPPSSLPILDPPKPPHTSSSRGDSIGWTSDSASREPTQKHGYTTEKLPAGSWLGYDGISSEQESASPEAKRRRRDRALSSGEAGREQPEQTKAALARAKEDALFRRVYSSFAPSMDNSSAVIPEETRNEMWLTQQAGPCQDEALAIDPDLGDDPSNGGEDEHLDADPESFQETVDNFDPAHFDGADFDAGEDGHTRSLREISDLLESLQSHQRVRNSHLIAAARVGSIQTPGKSTGAAPNDSEVTVYKQARQKLAEVVLQLKPYTLAKVGGNELANLLLSRDILVESRNYQGTMDDDQATRLAAAAALNNALGTSSTNRTTAVAGRPALPNHGRTSSTQVNPSTPTNAMRNGTAANKPPLSNWQSSVQNYTASGSRPNSYSQLNSYARTPLNNYNTRPNPSNISTGYQQTPTQPMYQQRAQNLSGQYSGYNNSSTPRAASATQPYTGYQSIVSRPPSTGYSNATTAPLAPMTGTSIQPRPQSQGTTHSPLPHGSPYAPPSANAVPNALSQSSRPITPSTPATSQVPQAQQPRQSPSVGAAPTQAVTSGSSNGTPAS
ncbi:MAG: hypothetical protein Q9159_005749 [Coniocarpon cinnabarinum]